MGLRWIGRLVAVTALGSLLSACGDARAPSSRAMGGSPPASASPAADPSPDSVQGCGGAAPSAVDGAAEEEVLDLILGGRSR